MDNFLNIFTIKHIFITIIFTQKGHVAKLVANRNAHLNLTKPAIKY